jgi:uncharacterized protein (TIGR02118 family)
MSFSNPFSRRTLLKTSAQGATLGALAAAVGCSMTGSMASQSIVGSTCMTILYENGDDVSFDFDYYRDNHLTMIMDLYGTDAIERFELRKPVDAPGPPSPYVAVVNIWVKDAEAFAAAGAEHGGNVAADVVNFTNTGLVLQNDTVWGESGAGIDSPEIGDRCMCIFYGYEDGGRWDADYYRDNHMTLIMDLYGREAISRFEVRQAQANPQGNPLFFGTVTFYIEDQASFDAAGLEHTQALVDDVPNFSSVNPSVLITEVYGLDT